MAREVTLQPLARWDPFRDLERDFFPSRLSRWMGEVSGDRSNEGVLRPAVDVTESDDSYEVSVELAGVKKDDVNVELHEGVLTIRGEKRSEREENRDKGRWLERTYGSFVRSFSLPADADGEKVDARFQDGVLKLSIHKRPEAKPRTVAING